MVRPLYSALAAIVVALAGASAPAQQTFHAKRVHGLDNGAPAFSVLVPLDWQPQGGVVWGQAPCNTYGFNFQWQAETADGLTGVALLPMHWWSTAGNELTNCRPQQIGSAREYLTLLVQALRPGAQVLDYRPRPDLVAETGLKPQRQAIYDFEMAQQPDAGEVLVAYRENGRDVRAAVSAVVTMWSTRAAPVMAGMPGFEVSGGMALPGWAVFAPDGQLNWQQGETIRKTISNNPAWERLIAKHVAEINRINRQGATDRHNITMAANREISQIISSGAAERDRINDRLHREQIESIRGVETYNDPINGGTVQLDHTYRHAWQLEDGTYFLTNDESFQPIQHLGVNGQRMTVAP